MKIKFFMTINILSSSIIFGLTPQEIDIMEQQKAKDRTKMIQESQLPKVKVDTKDDNNTDIITFFGQKEALCFDIEKIKIIGDEALIFQPYLDKILKDINFNSKGICLGKNGIKHIVDVMQNELINKGFVTSRVGITEQDLKSKILELKIIAGKVEDITFDISDTNKTLIYSIQKFNAIPTQKGRILNLRDIEQGLENFKRIQSVEADINIVPSVRENYSDLKIKWHQKEIPFRFSLSLDDSGSKGTGKYQANITSALDNLLNINDIFYISWGSDIAGYNKVNTLNSNGDLENKRGETGSRSIHYSVPLGYWLISFNDNRYTYHQAIAGSNQIYDYRGDNKSRDIALSYLFNRNSTEKSFVSWKGWEKLSKNFIDDAEVIVQKRKISGYEIALSHEKKLTNGSIDLRTSYKKGTGAKNATVAPEDLFGEGTHRMGIVNADIALNYNISPQLRYEGTIHSQWNRTSLIPQDKLSIGGRYSVRGFDGDLVLSSERGWISRNTFVLPTNQSLQMYFACDAGHVSGKSSQYLLGKSLIGAGVGLRGVLASNKLSYDVLVGLPLYKPKNFETQELTTGFNINFKF